MTGYTAAVDLGGTHVRVALVDDDGEVRRRIRVETPGRDDTPAALVDMIRDLALDGAAATNGGPGAERPVAAGRAGGDAAAAATDGGPGAERPVAAGRAGGDAADAAATDGECRAVVIGLPGVVDHEAEALVQAPNLNQAWIPLLTSAWFEDRLDLPVAMANDADLAAVGEAFFGAGRHYRDVVYVTISTGVGAGAVFDGSLVRGRRSGAEIGHTIVDLEAARRGLPATVEELGAGPAIAKAAAEAGLLERNGALADLVRSEHPVATELWARAIDAVAAGISNVAWVLAPDVVIIGGGVGVNNADLILPRITHWLQRHGPAVDRPIAVATAELGDDAALVGAARWFAARGRATANG